MKVANWEEYVSSLGGKTPERGMSAFHARFKLADSMRSIEAPGVATKSLNTYSSLCKLGLSYATLEHLENLLGIDGRPAIIASDLCQKVRATWPSGFEIIVSKMKVNGKLLLRLENLFNTDSAADVRPLAETLRHSIFHGNFTPFGWKLQSQEALVWIDGLSQVTLRMADQTFTTWFKSLGT